MSALTHCFIINSHAGYSDCTASLSAEIAQAFGDFSELYEIYNTVGNSDDTAHLRSRCQAGTPIRFYACGGDGTVHMVVNAVHAYPNASFAVIPCGTGNDYIKSIGGYRNLRHLLDFGQEKMVDLLHVNGVVCANIASMGLDANVNANTMKYKKNPILKGVAYYMGVAESILGKLGHSVEISMDGAPSAAESILMLAAAKGHYYGKTFHAAPLSDVCDRKIDVCFIRKISLLRILKLLPIYQKGAHVNRPDLADVICYQKLSQVKIHSEQALPISLDGELAYYHDIDIAVIPESICLFSLHGTQNAVQTLS